jgi:hypothetical protein
MCRLVPRMITSSIGLVNMPMGLSLMIPCVTNVSTPELFPALFMLTQAYVVCTKQISTGDEVFISYGAQFKNSLIDPSNPNKGTRRNNVDTTYSGYCDKHAQSVFCEDVDELYK